MVTQRERRLNLIVIGCVLAAGAAIVAVTVFGAPVRSVFFFAMIALCPLMHLFMGHGAHGHGAHGHGHGANKTSAPTEDSVASTTAEP